MRFKGVRQAKKVISYKYDPKESKRLIRGTFIESARGLVLRRKTKKLSLTKAFKNQRPRCC